MVWSKIENVKSINQIKHPTVKNLLKYFDIKQGLKFTMMEIYQLLVGWGSSSAFTVGLVNVLCSQLNKQISNEEIAKMAIHFEQKIMRETVGSQDQLATSIGGFNKIFFKKK